MKVSKFLSVVLASMLLVSSIVPTAAFAYETQELENGILFDPLDNDSNIFKKSDNLGFYSDNISVNSNRSGFVATTLRRNNSNDEAYVKYRLQDEVLNQISVVAYYFHNVGYAGSAPDDSSLIALEKTLAKEGIKFYESKDNVTYTEIESVAQTLDPSPWPGLTMHQVTYTVSGISADSKYFEILYPAMPDNTVYGWSARVDSVKFKYASADIPAETLVDNLDNSSHLLAKSDNVGFYTDHMVTNSDRSGFQATTARRDSDGNEGFISYELENAAASQITVVAYYWNQVGYAGTTGDDSNLTRLEAALQKEGIKFYQSPDNLNYTNAINVDLIMDPGPWPGQSFHKVTYKLSGLPADIKYFKIVFPALPDNTVWTNSARIDTVTIKTASNSTKVFDPLDNDEFMLNKSSNLEFHTDNIVSNANRSGFAATTVRREGSNDEAHITYELKGDAKISVDAYYWNQVGYAGTTGDDSNLTRLEATLQKEGVKFYESLDGIAYTEVSNVDAAMDPGPWPGQSFHRVIYNITGLSEGSKYFKIVFPKMPDNTVWGWSVRLDSVQFVYSASGGGTTKQKLSMPNMFMNNMILQAGKKVNIWGLVETGKTVTATLYDGTDTYTATGEGTAGNKFILSFDNSFDPGYTPYTLTVTDGTDTYSYNNIVFGDVYLLAGQSNMQMPMSDYVSASSGSEKAEVISDIANSGNENIRYMTVKRESASTPQLNAPIEKPWTSVNADTVLNLSAIGYYFAKGVQEEADYPVGLVDSSWGGTAIYVWVEKAEAYNNHIYPFGNFGIKGILWYQGESDEDKHAGYDTKFNKMVSHYRDLFNDENLPFGYVQLPRYAEANTGGFHMIRDMQLASFEHFEAKAEARGIQNTVGMISTIDQTASRTNIHPAGKKEIGNRLVNWAKAVIYRNGGEYTGPIAVRAWAENGEATVLFNHVGTGLVTKDGGAAVKGFKIAGADGVYYEASGVISGSNKVTHIKSESVADPVSVQYAFEEYPEEANLMNKESFAASPFSKTVTANAITGITMKNSSGGEVYQIAAGGRIDNVTIKNSSNDSGNVILALYESNVLKALAIKDVAASDYANGVAIVNVNMNIPSNINTQNTIVKAMFINSFISVSPLLDVYAQK